MKYLIVPMILTFLAILGCSDNPETPGGTLPIVQNCTILFNECKGDTVVLTWDPLTVTIDNYRVWYSATGNSSWTVVVNTEDTVTEHIALKAGYYCVDAVFENDESQDQSEVVNNIPHYFLNEDTMSFAQVNGVLFQDTTVVFGDASDPDFHQDVILLENTAGIMAYSGDWDSVNYPGGNSCKLASVIFGECLAPEYGNSAWSDSVQLINQTGTYVQLSNGFYHHFLISKIDVSSFELVMAQLHQYTAIRLFGWITL